MQNKKSCLFSILILVFLFSNLSAEIFSESESESKIENFSEQKESLQNELQKNQKSDENQLLQNQKSAENENSESQDSKQKNLDSDYEKIKSQVSENLKVTKINFSGLKKTKNFYIQSKLKKFLNVSVQDFDFHGFETALQLEGLFDDIQISMQDFKAGEASVEVSVKEKITFIPLPFAMYSDSSFMAGIMVMDTNAFGVKDMFAFGGVFAKDSLMGMAMFSKPPRSDGIPGFSVSVSTSKNTSTLANLEKDEILKYDAVNFYSSFSLTEQIGEFNSVSLGGFFSSVSTDQADDYLEVDSLKSAGGEIKYGISKSDWNGWFMSSAGAGISAAMTLYADDSDYNHSKTLSANFYIQKPVIDRMRFYSAGSAFYGDKLHVSSYSGGSAGSVSILPGNFKTRQIAGGNAGFELALVKGKIGTVSVYGDYQFVSAQDFDDDFYFMHGPNGGLRVYLAKIAFPALAMGISYNVAKNYVQFAAAMGISM